MRLFLSDMVKLAGGVAGLVRHGAGTAAGRGPRGFASFSESPPPPPPPFETFGETFGSDFFRPSGGKSGGQSDGQSDGPGRTPPGGPARGPQSGGPAQGDELQDIRCALQSILSRLEALETQAHSRAPDPPPDPRGSKEDAQGSPRKAP